MRTQSFIACLSLLAVSQLIAADAKPTREECDAWVARLANKTPWPSEEPYLLDPPKNVDRDALQDVKKAYDELSSHCTDALPSLIAALHDERYSYYQESSSGAYVPHSVGNACYEIIIAHVEIYRQRLTVSDETERPRTVYFISAMGGPEKWLSTRKTKSLFELQLEGIEWAMKQPRPNELITETAWQAALADLQMFHASFAAEKKPLTVRHVLWFEGK